MSQSDSIWAKVELKSPPQKFYGFFRNHMEDLVSMFPDQFMISRLVEGENLSSGTVFHLKYYLGGQLLTTKIKLRGVDDVKKYLIYEVVEGDLLKHYKMFRTKTEVIVNNGGIISFAKWTIEFEKANENVPSPQTHMEMFLNMSKAVDAYFSKN